MAKQPKLFMRHRDKGTIYNYSELALKDSAASLEVVTEEEAFPERAMPKKVRGRKSKVSLKTDSIPEAPPKTPVGLSTDASKGL